MMDLNSCYLCFSVSFANDKFTPENRRVSLHEIRKPVQNSCVSDVMAVTDKRLSIKHAP